MTALIMGVLNVTPDSFSDGGAHMRADQALAHARRMIAQGAAIVDVGGESTRPGAARVSADEEASRVLPVVGGLARAGARVSVDTMRAEVALAAVAAGATIVNDVSGGLADPAMAEAVASVGVEYVLSHWRGASATMDAHRGYLDVVAEVVDELAARRDAVVAEGVAPERVILDPGIGFSKDSEHNWELLVRLDELAALGHRLLVGVSRKRFVGEALGGRAPLGRDVATAVLGAVLSLSGVWCVRVHDVGAQSDALAVADRWARGRGGGTLPMG